MPNSKHLQDALIQIYRRDDDAIHAELSAGLQASHAFTSPKYLYDELGSKLFEAICLLPEYYPTRTEAAIFDVHMPEIAESVGQGTTLIDLGAGNCAKAARLFPVLLPTQYVPVDISVDFLRDAVSNLRQQFPQILMTGIGMDFSSKLELPPAVRREKRLFFYPGSSIGNFTPAEAVAFLRRLSTACRSDAHSKGSLLIGVDLVKDKATLDAAYDDALGVTASFNLNLLQHLNRMLNADFDVRNWRHHGFYNQELSRVEMHLEARSNLNVRWRGGQRGFERGERIHTENSYKYTPEGFEQLLREGDFCEVASWTDPRGWFMLSHARAT